VRCRRERSEIAAAASKTEAQGSGRFEARGTAVARNGKRTALACSGSADYDHKRVHVRCVYEGRGVFEAIAIGNDFYLRGTGDLGFGSDKWAKETGTADGDTSLANLSPQHLFSLLRRASSVTEHIGEEEVRGEASTRYRLTVDCDTAYLNCDDTAPVDVWVADDGTIRRIALNDDDGPVTFEFFDFGADVSIEAPPSDQVREIGDLLKPEPCPDDPARPISVDRAMEALRDHGFPVDKRNSTCSGGVSAWLTTNGSQDGGLSCIVLANPIAAGGLLVGEGASGASVQEPVQRQFENLQCSLGPDDPGARAAVERLDDALADLKRPIGP
jgi:hypothetical protein